MRRFWAAALCAILLVSCNRSREVVSSSGEVEGRRVGAELAGDSPESRKIADGLLDLAERGAKLGLVRPSLSRKESTQELIRLAQRVKQVSVGPPAIDSLHALNRVIFQESRFEREVDDPHLKHMYLPSVLRSHKGSCFGLASLYLALGERLDLDLHGVLVPGHFFVRQTGLETHVNVELLRRGEAMPDRWYQRKYSIPNGNPAYMRGLSTREVEGVLRYNEGAALRAAGRLGDAEQTLEAAVESLEGFAEAHASLGAIQQLLGKLDAARTSYGEALRFNPDLEGVSHNSELLRKELAERARSVAP